jgi:hypothetical protein
MQTSPVFDPLALQMVLLVLIGWLERRERDASPTLSKRIACSGGS